jgi:hypothetical protein
VAPGRFDSAGDALLRDLLPARARGQFEAATFAASTLQYMRRRAQEKTASLCGTRGFSYQTSQCWRRWSRFEKGADRVVTSTHPFLIRAHSLGLAPPSERCERLVLGPAVWPAWRPVLMQSLSCVDRCRAGLQFCLSPGPLASGRGDRLLIDRHRQARFVDQKSRIRAPNSRVFVRSGETFGDLAARPAATHRLSLTNAATNGDKSRPQSTPAAEIPSRTGLAQHRWAG